VKWVSAVGNPITQVKYHKDSKQVVTPWGKYDVIYPSLAFNTAKIHKEKQRNAIAANRTHELDSSHLVLIVDDCKKKGIRLITIHDCFSCHPNDVDVMRDTIWDTFKRLYSTDRVEDFRNSANEYYQKGLRQEDEDDDVMLHRILMRLTGDVLQSYTDYGDLELPDNMPLYFFS
jgi:DNA-directed RNA polymerase